MMEFHLTLMKLNTAEDEKNKQTLFCRKRSVRYRRETELRNSIKMSATKEFCDAEYYGMSQTKP